MKKYRYTVSTNTIWASFDNGELFAEDEADALEKAKTQLKYDFDKVNSVLNSADVTEGFKIEFDINSVTVKLV
jgi:hypothetical protein